MSEKQKVYKKTVRFDYYQVNLKVLERGVFRYELYDLSYSLVAFSEIEPGDRNLILSNGDEVRIQYVDREFIDNNKYDDIWKMQVVRMRKGLVAGIAKDSGEFRPIELEADEGLGEDIAVLYDRRFSILAVQRNRNSVSPGGLIEYFNIICKDDLPDKSELILKPILNKNELPSLSSEMLYRKIQFDFAQINLNDIDENEKSRALVEIAKVKDMFPNLFFKIEISVGRQATKDTALPNAETTKIISNLRHITNKDSIKQLKVALKRNAECRVEHFDLLETKIYDSHDFSYTRISNILHEDIIGSMLMIYIDRRGDFESMLEEQL